jgi:hypothetical protein
MLSNLIYLIYLFAGNLSARNYLHIFFMFEYVWICYKMLEYIWRSLKEFPCILGVLEFWDVDFARHAQYHPRWRIKQTWAVQRGEACGALGPWGLEALAEADSIDPDRENKSMIRTLYWSSLPANTSLWLVTLCHTRTAQNVQRGWLASVGCEHQWESM